MASNSYSNLTKTFHVSFEAKAISFGPGLFILTMSVITFIFFVFFMSWIKLIKARRNEENSLKAGTNSRLAGIESPVSATAGQSFLRRGKFTLRFANMQKSSNLSLNS